MTAPPPFAETTQATRRRARRARLAFAAALLGLAPALPGLAAPPMGPAPAPAPAPAPEQQPAAPSGFTRTTEAPGVLWRPQGGAATTLLVEMDTEPREVRPGDFLDIARQRKMAVVFPAAGANEELLRGLVKRLRPLLGIKYVIGHGVGPAGEILRRTAVDGRSFGALLLHDRPPSTAPAARLPPVAGAPLIIETFGSDAFWRNEQKTASPPPPRGRRFFLAGAAGRGETRNCAAPVNERSILPAQRALLAALDDFLAKGTQPPASREAELAPARDLRFPSRLPAPPWRDERLVPSVDSDGNEKSGLRLPDQALPIATYTGWNARKDKDGPPCDAGAAVPFPGSATERAEKGDSRPALPERYGSRAYFVATMRAVADRLVKDRLLLKEDADAYVAQAKQAPF